MLSPGILLLGFPGLFRVRVHGAGRWKGRPSSSMFRQPDPPGGAGQRDPPGDLQGSRCLPTPSSFCTQLLRPSGQQTSRRSPATQPHTTSAPGRGDSAGGRRWKGRRRRGMYRERWPVGPPRQAYPSTPGGHRSSRRSWLPTGRGEILGPTLTLGPAPFPKPFNVSSREPQLAREEWAGAAGIQGCRAPAEPKKKKKNS